MRRSLISCRAIFIAMEKEREVRKVGVDEMTVGGKQSRRSHKASIWGKTIFGGSMGMLDSGQDRLGPCINEATLTGGICGRNIDRLRLAIRPLPSSSRSLSSDSDEKTRIMSVKSRRQRRRKY